MGIECALQDTIITNDHIEIEEGQLCSTMRNSKIDAVTPCEVAINWRRNSDSAVQHVTDCMDSNSYWEFLSDLVPLEEDENDVSETFSTGSSCPSSCPSSRLTIVTDNHKTHSVLRPGTEKQAPASDQSYPCIPRILPHMHSSPSILEGNARWEACEMKSMPLDGPKLPSRPRSVFTSCLDPMPSPPSPTDRPKIEGQKASWERRLLAQSPVKHRRDLLKKEQLRRLVSRPERRWTIPKASSDSKLNCPTREKSQNAPLARQHQK